MGLFGKKPPRTPAEDAAARERGRQAEAARNRALEKQFDRLYAKQRKKP